MTKKIKPVKAWAVISRRGKIEPEAYMYKIDAQCNTVSEDDKIIRVLITPIK